MFKRMAAVEMFDGVIGKRELLALDVEHQVDVRSRRDVDAEKAVTLVRTTAELDAGCGAQLGLAGRLHHHPAMIDGRGGGSKPLRQPVAPSGLAPHTRIAPGGRYSVTVSPPTALLRNTGVPAVKLRLRGSDCVASGGTET